MTSETAVDTETKKELSSLHQSIRLIQDENQWFNGKKGGIKKKFLFQWLVTLYTKDTLIFWKMHQGMET